MEWSGTIPIPNPVVIYSAFEEAGAAHSRTSITLGININLVEGVLKLDGLCHMRRPR
jgi:hypothetical protein